MLFAGIWRIDAGDVDRRRRLLPRDVNGLLRWQTVWAGDVGTFSLFRRDAGGGVHGPGAVARFGAGGTGVRTVADGTDCGIGAVGVAVNP